MASLNDELDDRFVEVEIETSEVNRLRDVFEKNEKTISGLEENRQKIQNEYDLMKAEDDELDDKLKSQLKFIGKETYKLIKTLKWGAPSRWSLGPISAWGSIETTTIGKMYPTL